MKRDDYWRAPKKAKAIAGKDAWWYADKGSISVCVAIPGTVLTCSITRRDLEAYLKRSTPQKEQV
jgi:hypothetical protein